ncbi:MAG: hypothetical protein LBU48_06830 [Coriobacteriales bacterium]|jgi:hypothetical protein|nr:hypothetical protein [Coriobacteriales bacterium]
MSVRQLSIFVENSTGKVSRITDVLDQAQVSIRGFSLADTIDYGIAHIVVDKPEQAREALEQAGFLVQVHDILCIELPDEPGALGLVFRAVGAAGINVQYSYSLVATYVVLKVDDVELAEAQLAAQPLRRIDQSELTGIVNAQR